MNLAAPRVSVVLPTYNRGGVLPRAIQSVLAQTFRDFELIVVDDGSTDHTAEVVRAFTDPRLIYLPPERNLGDAGARNRGIASARGEWIAFQDSDDEWTLHKLELQLALADTLPADVAVIGGALMRVHANGVMYWPWPLEPDQPAIGGIVDRGGFIAGLTAFLQTMLIRREVLQAAGGFYEGLKACSDIEFCYRILDRHRFAAVRDTIAVVHETQGSLALNQDYRRLALRYLLEHHRPLLGEKRVVLSHYQYCLALTELESGNPAAARRIALQAVASAPWRLKPWALALLSLLGPEVVDAARKLSQAVRGVRRPQPLPSPPGA